MGFPAIELECSFAGRPRPELISRSFGIVSATIFYRIRKNPEFTGVGLFCSKFRLDHLNTYGGFIASFIPSKVKILINPCLLPSEQIRLRARPDVTNEELQKYKGLEAMRIVSNEEKAITHGFFATHDELFSYRNLFEELYDSNKAYSMDDGHRISPENVKAKVAALVRHFL